MALKNTPQEWGSMSKFLHWSVVVLIVGQGILGLTMGDLPRDGAIHPVRLHKSIGVLILTLAVFRLVWTYAISRRPEELLIVPAGADLFEVKARLGLDDGRRLKPPLALTPAAETTS